jgi:hypothetical protein
MSRIVAFIMKNILTESIIKKIVGVLGDYLVNSTKNNLDNKLWTSVKKSLGV